MIYLDSSALLKLIVEESESAELEGWLDERADTPLISSELVRTEVVRAARRLDQRAAATARALVDQLDLVPVSTVVLDRAADIGPAELRSLDAIHLAAASSVADDLTGFVAYDRRLVAAAETAGFAVAMPGAG